MKLKRRHKRFLAPLFAAAGTMMTLVATLDGRTLAGGLASVASIASWLAAIAYAAQVARKK